MLVFVLFSLSCFMSPATSAKLTVDVKLFALPPALSSDTPDCATETTVIAWEMDMGVCFHDPSLNQWVILQCEDSGNKISELCYSDNLCNNQIACFNDGDTSKFYYTPGQCITEFVYAYNPDYNQPSWLVPYTFDWTSSECVVTAGEEALADSGHYEALSAIEAAHSGKDIIYSGLAVIGIFSIIRGFYIVYQQNYKAIPVEEEADV